MDRDTADQTIQQMDDSEWRANVNKMGIETLADCCKNIEKICPCCYQKLLLIMELKDCGKLTDELYEIICNAT